MMNLCTNAAHAMENKGGTLEITLKDITLDETTMRVNHQLKPGNYIEIKVSDTGNGIESHVIDKVFEPYFTTKGLGEGTGMRLAMVHGIVETYGGKIFVASTLGQGTIFTLYLPTAKEKNAPPLYTYMTMPEMAGDQLSTKPLEIRRDIPIILCTGYSKRLSKENASAIGIKALTHKPIAKVELAKTVRKVLDESKVSIENENT